MMIWTGSVIRYLIVSWVLGIPIVVSWLTNMTTTGYWQLEAINM